MAKSINLTPQKGESRASWQEVVLLLLAIGLPCGAWVSFQGYDRQLEKQYTERIEAITTGIPVLVASIRYVEQPFQDMQPAVRWSGEGAKILLVAQYQDAPAFGGKRTRWTVLARTPKGRFFSANYELSRKEECEEVLKCAELKAIHGLTDNAARAKVFRAGKSELYRELFGTDMPPTEVKA